jgi:hypothetical protein
MRRKRAPQKRIASAIGHRSEIAKKVVVALAAREQVGDAHQLPRAPLGRGLCHYM